MGSGPSRIITLDTNIWLDLLLFHNPPSQALAQRLAANGWRAAVSGSSLRELHRVLSLKPQVRPEWRLATAKLALELENAMQAAQLPPDQAAVDLIELAGLPITICNGHATARLPQCRDATDQQFLQLAAASNSQVLLTRDKALLKCRNYPLNAANFDGATRGTVMTPAQLIASSTLHF